MTEFGKIKAYYPELKDVGAPSPAELNGLDAQLNAAKVRTAGRSGA